jgi:hypothetical protein
MIASPFKAVDWRVKAKCRECLPTNALDSKRIATARQRIEKISNLTEKSQNSHLIEYDLQGDFEGFTNL